MHLVGIPTKWMRLPKGVRLGKKGPGGVGPKSSTKMVCFFCCFAPKNKKRYINSTQQNKGFTWICFRSTSKKHLVNPGHLKLMRGRRLCWSTFRNNRDALPT
jgi:hypothetical protein